MRSVSCALAWRAGLALSVVWASLPGEAAADELVPSLNVQTGVTVTRSPGNDTNDYFVAATPAVSYFLGTERLQLGLTYSFTGSINTELPNAIANRVAITAATDLSPTTRLLFGVEGLVATIGNYVLIRRSASTQIGGLPALNTTLLTLQLSQAVQHEISPVVRFSQSIQGTYVTTLDQDPRFSNYLAGTTLGIDRGWEFDAVGGEFTAQWSRTVLPPVATRVITVALGPTWDHDFSRSLTGSAGVSAALAFSPDPNTTPRLAPAGRASMLYYSDASGIELGYAFGFEPNILLGTLLQSHQVTIRGYTPISEENRVILGVSAGYLRAKTLDLQPNGQNANEFEAVLHDAEVSWGAADFLSMYLRYQFIGQTQGAGLGATPPLVRHGVIFGFDLFGGGRPDRKKPRVQTKFPQRVDGKDSPIPEKRR